MAEKGMSALIKLQNYLQTCKGVDTSWTAKVIEEAEAENAKLREALTKVVQYFAPGLDEGTPLANELLREIRPLLASPEPEVRDAEQGEVMPEFAMRERVDYQRIRQELIELSRPFIALKCDVLNRSLPKYLIYDGHTEVIQSPEVVQELALIDEQWRIAKESYLKRVGVDRESETQKEPK